MPKKVAPPQELQPEPHPMFFADNNELVQWLTTPRVMGFLLKLSKSLIPGWADPSDGFGELCVLLLSRMEAGQAVPQSLAYIVRCLWTACRRLRKGSDRETPLDESWLNAIPDDTDLEEQLFLKQLTSAMKEVKHGPLLMRSVFAPSLEVLAAEEGLAKGTVSNYLSQARERLRRLFPELCVS